MANQHIAIIGGGAAATLLLAHFALHPSAQHAEYHVYDRVGAFAKGIAYSTSQMAHLLNVRAANMSALATDPHDFAAWVASSYQPSDFVPRKIYGDYLMDKLAAAQSILNIKLHQEHVVSCRRMNGVYVLECASGQRSYDHVIQATGNCQALSPVIDGEVGNYYAQPWGVNYNALKNLSDVTLIGCGLSAVDAVLSLNAHGYEGHITILSRRTLLPRVHVDAPSYPAFFEPQQLPSTVREALKIVRIHLERAAAQNIPWQSVIDAIRPMTNLIWQGWSDKEQLRFMRHLLTLWNVHRHRMAPQIAAVLASYQEQGRLNFKKARALKVISGPRIITSHGEIKTQAVINCLGYRYQEPGHAFEVSDKIGPALFGSLFETTAIPEIRMQADALAKKFFS